MNNNYGAMTLRKNTLEKIGRASLMYKKTKISVVDEAIDRYLRDMKIKESDYMTFDEASEKIGKILRKTKNFKKYKLSDLDISNAY